MDEKQSLIDHLPLVAVLIGGSTLLLLFALTGSIILPIKTLIMNALTLGASLGVIVLAFQEGLLDDVFAYTGPAAIEVTSMAFLFAVTFALATDYAVLVLARIKEQHDRGESNVEAVAVGIGRTGRVITAAAAAIAVVFLAFAVSKVFFMKQIAIGEMAAVIIDTTIVRALLVPALMALFGQWNWWAPGPLKRLQMRLASGSRTRSGLRPAGGPSSTSVSKSRNSASSATTTANARPSVACGTRWANIVPVSAPTRSTARARSSRARRWRHRREVAGERRATGQGDDHQRHRRRTAEAEAEPQRQHRAR